MLDFDKYRTKGAYHWEQYNNGTIYTQHIQRMLKWVRAGSTLDVGAGDGVLTFFLGAEGIDTDETAVQLAKEHQCSVRLGSVYSIEGVYDNIVLSDVLEHLERPEDALEQVKNALNIGGRLYIVTPPPIPHRNKPRKYHFQEWSSAQLVMFMAENGFKCLNIDVAPELIRIYGEFEIQYD